MIETSFSQQKQKFSETHSEKSSRTHLDNKLSRADLDDPQSFFERTEELLADPAMQLIYERTLADRLLEFGVLRWDSLAGLEVEGALPQTASCNRRALALVSRVPEIRPHPISLDGRFDNIPLLRTTPIEATIVDLEPQMRKTEDTLEHKTDGFLSRGLTLLGRATTPNVLRDDPDSKEQRERFAAEAADAAFNRVQERLASSVPGKLAQGVFAQADQIRSYVAGLFKKRSFRVMLGGLIFAAGLEGLQRIEASKGSIKAFIRSWLDKIGTLVSFLPKALGWLRQILATAMKSLSQSILPRDDGAPGSDAKLDPLEGFTPEMSHAFPTGYGVLLALLAFFAFGSVPKGSKPLEILNVGCRAVTNLQRGFSSFQSMASSLTDNLPGDLKRLAYVWFGFGEVKPEIVDLWARTLGLQYRYELVGKAFWASKSNTLSAKRLYKTIHETRTTTFTGLAASLLRQCSDILKKMLQTHEDTEEKVFSKILVMFLGEPGLGKTYAVREFGGHFSASNQASVHHDNPISDFSDGYQDQPISQIDDMLAARLGPEALARQVMDLLHSTSEVLCHLNMADLGEKGMIDRGLFTCVTTNATLDDFSRHFAYPQAFQRRIYGSYGAVIHFHASKEMRRRLCASGVEPARLQQGEIGAELVEAGKRLFTDAEKQRWMHVDFWYDRYDSSGNVVSTQISCFEDLCRLLIRKHLAAFEAATSVSDEMKASWRDGMHAKAARALEAELKVKFDKDDNDCYTIPFQYRTQFLRVLHQQMSDKAGDARLLLPRDEVKEQAPEFKTMDSFLSSFESGDLDSKSEEVDLKPIKVSPLTHKDWRQTLALWWIRIKEIPLTEVLMSVGLGTLIFGAFKLVQTEAPSFDALVRSHFTSVVDQSTAGSDKAIIIVDNSEVCNFQMQSFGHKKLAPPRENKASRLVNATKVPNFGAQSKVDTPTVQAIIAKVRRNIVGLQTVGGSCHGTFLGRNYFGSVLHAFLKLNCELGTDAFRGPDNLVQRSDANYPYSLAVGTTYTLHDWPRDRDGKREGKRRSHTFDVEAPDFYIREVEYPAWSDSKRPSLSDFVVVTTGPKAMRPFGDLDSHIVGPNQLEQLERYEGYMITLDGIKPVGPIRIRKGLTWSEAVRDRSGLLVHTAYRSVSYKAVSYRPVTVDGDCGCPVGVVAGDRFLVVGIHVGKNEDVGVAMPCIEGSASLVQAYQEMQLQTQINATPPLPSEDLDSSRSEWSAFGAYHVGPTPFPFFPGRKTKLYRGPFADTAALRDIIAEDKHLPTPLGGSITDRLEREYLYSLEPHLDECMVACIDDTLDRLGGGEVWETMPLKTVFAGFRHPDCNMPHIPPVDLNTSPGVTWPSADKRPQVVECGEFPDHYVEPNEACTNSILELVEIARTRLPTVWFSLFKKDEPLKESKLEAGLERLVRGSPMEYLGACRHILGGLFNAVSSGGAESELVFGFNPESYQFQQLSDRLDNTGSGSRRFGFDVKNMDANHKFTLAYLIARRIARKFTDDDHYNTRVNLIMATFVRSESLGFNGLAVVAGLASGSPLTTIFNGVTLASLVKYSFLMTRPPTEVRSLEWYHTVVASGHQGDDAIVSVNTKRTTFKPDDVARIIKPFFTVTDPSKAANLQWDEGGGEFLSRRFHTRYEPLIPEQQVFPFFSRKRLIKSLTWFRRGELPEEELALAKLNNLLLLLMGSGRVRFDLWRRRFKSAMKELGFGGHLRTYEDCVYIWRNPEKCREVLSSFTPEIRTDKLAGLRVNHLVGFKPQMLGIGSVAKNIIGVVQETVDEAAKVADRVLDTPNVGQMGTSAVLQPFYPGNNQQVTQMQYLDLPAAPERRAESSDFGMGMESVSLEHLCKPTWLMTGSISRDPPETPGTILATGLLVPNPKTCGALNNESVYDGVVVEPTSCGYVSTIGGFRTYTCESFLLDVYFACTQSMTFTVAVTLLPNTLDIPGTISDLQRCYTTYFKIGDGVNSFTAKLPWNTDMGYKFVPRGAVTREESPGRWVLWVLNPIVALDGAPVACEFNVSFGMEGVKFGGYGMSNLSVVPLTAGGGVTAARETLPRRSLGKADEKHRFVELKGFKPQMESPIGSGSALDSKGVNIEPSNDAPEARLPMAQAPAVTTSTGELDTSSWNYANTASRWQRVVTVNMETQPAGTVLWNMAIPTDAIVGTILSAFRNFTLFSGVFEVMASTLGQINSAGTAILYYSPTEDGNTAAILSEGKVSQTFLPNKMLSVASANSVTLTIPFVHEKVAWNHSDLGYAQVFLRVFNPLNVGTTSETSRVPISIFARVRPDSKFWSVNPSPNVFSERIELRRANLLRRFGVTDQLGCPRRPKPKETSWVEKTRWEHIDFHPQMLSSDPNETVQDVVVGANAQSANVELLSASSLTVNELCRRFVPVATSVTLQAAPLTLTPVDVLSPQSGAAVFNLNGLSQWGAMFGGFRGSLKFYITGNTHELNGATASWTSYRGLNFAATTELWTNTGSIRKSFSPWQRAQDTLGNHMLVVSPWISPKRFVRIQRVAEASNLSELGCLVIVNNKSPGTSGADVYAAFADGASFGLPICVPRIQLGVSSTIPDEYPALNGVELVAEFLEFRHVPGTPLPIWPRATAELAIYSEPLVSGGSPPTVKEQAGIIRISSMYFSPSELASFGVILDVNATLRYDPGSVSTVEADLTNFVCVPVTTRIIFDSGATGSFQPNNTQEFIAHDPLGTVLDSVPNRYIVSETVTVNPPWDSKWVDSTWNISISEVPVPRPVLGEKVTNFQSTFTAGSPALTYGRVNNFGNNSKALLDRNSWP